MILESAADFLFIGLMMFIKNDMILFNVHKTSNKFQQQIHLCSLYSTRCVHKTNCELDKVNFLPTTVLKLANCFSPSFGARLGEYQFDSEKNAKH